MLGWGCIQLRRCRACLPDYPVRPPVSVPRSTAPAGDPSAIQRHAASRYRVPFPIASRRAGPLANRLEPTLPRGRHVASLLGSGPANLSRAAKACHPSREEPAADRTGNPIVPSFPSHGKGLGQNREPVSEPPRPCACVRVCATTRPEVADPWPQVLVLGPGRRRGCSPAWALALLDSLPTWNCIRQQGRVRAAL